ncbi:hypothetical protein L596_015534 [Steinernema carpocapsae]|uniref:Uncharacterized protein n=1 Tax=Steinernema carpocapsae TaxID=34508 RepID=A0A4U5NGA0_STECR|nr:hypothetical protein L596_015534 [Steinernema carpocapsae]
MAEISETHGIFHNLADLLGFPRRSTHRDLAAAERGRPGGRVESAAFHKPGPLSSPHEVPKRRNGHAMADRVGCQAEPSCLHQGRPTLPLRPESALGHLWEGDPQNVHVASYFATRWIHVGRTRGSRRLAQVLQGRTFGIHLQ